MSAEAYRRAWLLKKLAGAGPLAREAESRVRCGGVLIAIPDVEGDLEEGADGLDNDPVLATLMASWAGSDSFGLVVENDLADEGSRDVLGGRPDRLVSERDDAAVIAGAIVQWMAVDAASAPEAPGFLNTSASGYPTVAFAVPAGFLPRMRAKRWDPEFVQDLAAAALAVIVSAFDNEGWIIWHPD